MHCDHTNVRMPQHLLPAAVDLDVPLAPQSREFLVTSHEFGDEIGQPLILRMRGPRGAQVGDPFPHNAFAVDIELTHPRMHQAQPHRIALRRRESVEIREQPRHFVVPGQDVVAVVHQHCRQRRQVDDQPGQRRRCSGGKLVGVAGTRKSFNFALGTLTERNLAIADVVKEVTTEQGRTPAQVGLAWTLQKPGVTAPIIGARTPAQLADNLGALDVDFTASQLARLDEASVIELGAPHDLLASDHIRNVVKGDLKIETRR